MTALQLQQLIRDGYNPTRSEERQHDKCGNLASRVEFTQNSCSAVSADEVGYVIRA